MLLTAALYVHKPLVNVTFLAPKNEEWATVHFLSNLLTFCSHSSYMMSVVSADVGGHQTKDFSFQILMENMNHGVKIETHITFSVALSAKTVLSRLMMCQHELLTAELSFTCVRV